MRRKMVGNMVQETAEDLEDKGPGGGKKEDWAVDLKKKLAENKNKMQVGRS